MNILDEIKTVVINNDKELKKNEDFIKKCEITETEIIKQLEDDSINNKNKIIASISNDSNICYNITTFINSDNKLVSINIEPIGCILNKVESNKLLKYLNNKFGNWGFVKILGIGFQIIAYPSNLIYETSYFNIEHYILQQVFYTIMALDEYHMKDIRVVYRDKFI